MTRGVSVVGQVRRDYLGQFAGHAQVMLDERRDHVREPFGGGAPDISRKSQLIGFEQVRGQGAPLFPRERCQALSQDGRGMLAPFERLDGVDENRENLFQGRRSEAVNVTAGRVVTIGVRAAVVTPHKMNALGERLIRRQLVRNAQRVQVDVRDELTYGLVKRVMIDRFDRREIEAGKRGVEPRIYLPIV